jgi:tRNA(fMet)-specific endonuclease VapC
VAINGILLDTNAYAAFKRGESDAVEIIRFMPLIGVSTIMLGELFAGFAFGKREAANMQELNRFLDSNRVKIFSTDRSIAQKYAIIYRNLRHKGYPIPTNDMWIAATALQHDLGLFSYDAHFRYADGIVAGNKLSDFLLYL